MFEEKDENIIKEFRDAFIFETAWQLESGLESNCYSPKAEKHVQTATVIFNKALGRTGYAGRADLLVSVEDVEKKRNEMWGREKEPASIASGDEVASE